MAALDERLQGFLVALAGVAGCLERLGGLPQVLLWDRQAGIHGDQGRPSEAFAAFCGQLRIG